MCVCLCFLRVRVVVSVHARLSINVFVTSLFVVFDGCDAPVENVEKEKACLNRIALHLG